MFGLGFWEILMIALVVIVFVPPKDMPKVFSKIGQVYGEMRSFNRSVRNTMRTLELDADRESRAARRKQRDNADSDATVTAGNTETGNAADTTDATDTAETVRKES